MPRDAIKRLRERLITIGRDGVPIHDIVTLLNIAEAAQAVWISRADIDWRQLESALARLEAQDAP